MEEERESEKKQIKTVMVGGGGGGGEYHTFPTNERNSKQTKRRMDIKVEKDRVDGEHDDTTLKKPRVVWSHQLQHQFVEAVNQLGVDKAVPKKILELMNVPGLTRENVASHLQKFRLHLKRINGIVPENQSKLNTQIMEASFTSTSSFDDIDTSDFCNYLSSSLESYDLSPSTSTMFWCQNNSLSTEMVLQHQQHFITHPQNHWQLDIKQQLSGGHINEFAGNASGRVGTTAIFDTSRDEIYERELLCANFRNNHSDELSWNSYSLSSTTTGPSSLMSSDETCDFVHHLPIQSDIQKKVESVTQHNDKALCENSLLESKPDLGGGDFMFGDNMSDKLDAIINWDLSFDGNLMGYESQW